MGDKVSSRSVRLGLEQAFIEAQDEKLTEMAVLRGLVTSADVVAARELRGAPRLLERLVAGGYLRPDDAATLEEALGIEDSQRPAADRPPLPPEAAVAASDL